jgi:hypothetical protein
LALPGDVIEFGIVRKEFKEYSHPGLLDFNSVKLEKLADLVNKTPTAFSSASNECSSQ